MTVLLTQTASNEAPYAGKVIILVNERSQSQSEYTTMARRAVPGAKVVGSNTAGADGNVSTIILRGNIFTWISGLGVYYPAGRETSAWEPCPMWWPNPLSRASGPGAMRCWRRRCN